MNHGRSVVRIGLWGALAGCGAATPIPSPIAAVTVAPALPPVARPPWQVVVVPGYASVHHFPGDAADETLVAVGGFRAVVRGDQVRFARQATLQPFAAITHDEAHWYAFTMDGVQLRGDSFDGDFTRVGETGMPTRTSFAGEGTAMALTRDRHVWISTPTGPFREIAFARGALVDMGFVTGGFGVVITEPGRLHRTTDGGAHYEPVTLPGDAIAYNSTPDRDAFMVYTSSGTYRLDRTGDPVVEPGWHRPPTSMSPTAAAALRATADHLLSDSPFARAFEAVATEVRLDDGRRAAIGRGRDGHSTLDVWSHAGLDRHGFDLGAGQCTVHRWPGGLATVCLDANAGRLEVSTTDGVVPPGVQMHVEAEPHVPLVYVADPGGGVIIADRPCDPSDRRASGTSLESTGLCRVTASGAQTLWLPDRVQIGGLWGDQLLAGTRVGLGTAVYDLRDPSAAPVRLQFDRAFRSSFLRLVGPDRVLGALYGRDDAVWLVSGTIGETLVSRSAPPGTRVIDPIDATAAVAVVPAGRSVYFVTYDEGRSWAPLELPIDGHPVVDDLFDPTHPRVIDDGVRLGAQVALLRPDAPAVPPLPEPLVAARSPGGATYARRRDPSALAAAHDYVPPHVECPAASSTAVAPPAGTTDTPGPDGWYRTREVRGHTELVAWGGSDRTGGFQVNASGTIPAIDAGDHLAVLAATRAMLVLLHARADSSRPEEVFVAAPGRPLRHLVFDASIFTVEPMFDHLVVFRFLVVDDRHAAMMLMAARRDGSPTGVRTGLVAMIDREGHATVVQRFAAMRQWMVLARLGDRTGVVLIDEDPPTRARFFAADADAHHDPAPVDLPDIRLRAQAVCDAARHADPRAIELFLGGDASSGDVTISGQRIWHAFTTLRLDPHSGDACLDRMALAAVDPDQTIYRIDAHDGDLVATRHAVPHDVAVRCRLLPAAR